MYVNVLNSAVYLIIFMIDIFMSIVFYQCVMMIIFLLKKKKNCRYIIFTIVTYRVTSMF